MAISTSSQKGYEMLATNDGSVHFPQNFPKFNIFSILVILRAFKKFVNNLVIYSQKKKKKLKWHYFKAIFAVILRTFDLESYGQTSVKIVFMFGLVFMKFKKFKCLHQEKNLIYIKLRCFHYLSNSLLYEVKTIFKLLFPIFD